MNRLRLFPAMLGLMVLQACMTAPTPPTNASAAAAIPTSQTFLFSWGMFADPVFDRDVVTFDRAYSQSFGAPTQTELFGFTAARLNDPNPANMQNDLTQMAAQAVDGQDLIIVMMTSHGSPDLMAIKATPNGPTGSLSADAIAEFLSPLQNDRQILILQACFSGSLIDELRSPNRIILTAAAADRSSFGCNPDSDNTWFIKSLNRAMVEVANQGGSWQQIFARTKTLVAADEARAGVQASNPQSYVGANMRDLWTQSAL